MVAVSASTAAPNIIRNLNLRVKANNINVNNLNFPLVWKSWNRAAFFSATAASTTTTSTGSTTSARTLQPSPYPTSRYNVQSRSIATMASQEAPEDLPQTTPPEGLQQQMAKEDAAAAAVPAPKESVVAEPELPKLSAAEFRVYNRLAVMMDAYHNHFRYTWNLLYKTCTSGTRPAGMSIRAFISQGLHLCHALTVHHTIEERHIFPELAERMPAFAPQEHLISQHEQIHEGLEKLEAYLDACRTGERELRLPELKEIMDSFGEVLWTHLDDEVRMLGAENMRKHWSKDEILSMNW
ncbi:hypothetical protein HRR90_008487 [Exophiala dermatitidis]|uniref:Hemerythrin-like domain-containing protein n=2 Tax=Exophiala dermatitidis TaxID=5970 RepID=H6BLS3_EXODN|nr:uncharacterized protein HMPREF1120_01115 [Exophiala dermatitidis NIH/UT8656]KAJ4502878.1 hypothetical protein HRR73_009306 [Exophiala dermatitidis]EHY52912.1 hypothetical protein HMPREF1120_01115 [Exophiala dermatitidis NIH/UT8656]KAJ4512279.1 hypothetical protein HRR75_005180 [Exophiala dermatitidis]KAJ4515186.1 hypothetical protein HRR74_005652 [Exophiala dermatitidis]KAJ4548561.1 hypothetical protein HRR76_001152 [Exophiala dermatitidis]